MRHVSPPIPPKNTPRPIYEAIRRLSDAAQGNTQGLAAVGRGDSPDSSGYPVVIIPPSDHHTLGNLTTFDDHPQYLYLNGRTGGQTIKGLAIGDVPITIAGMTSGQSANLQNWTANNSTVAQIAADGTIVTKRVYISPASGALISTLGVDNLGFTVPYGSLSLEKFGSDNSLGNWVITPQGSVVIGGPTNTAVNQAMLNIRGWQFGTLPLNGSFLELSCGTSLSESIAHVVHRVDNAAQWLINVTGMMATTSIPFRIFGSVGQSADLMQWRTSLNAPLAAVSAAGTMRMSGFQLGTSSTAGWILTTNSTGVGTWTAPSTTGLGVLSASNVWTGPQTILHSTNYLSGLPALLTMSQAGSNDFPNFIELYDNTGILLAFIDSSGSAMFNGVTLLYSGLSAVIDASLLTANRTVYLPDTTGTLITTGSTTDVLSPSLSLNHGSTLYSVSATTGVSFSDATSASKRLRVVLSGASIGNNVLAVVTTTGRTFTFPDTTGTVLISVFNSLSADTTLSSLHRTVFVDATGASRTITLPTAVGISGKEYIIKKIDSSINTVTIGTTSSQTIDGAATQILLVQYAVLRVISDGANWGVI